MTMLSPQRWLRIELQAIDSQVGRWHSRRFEVVGVYPAPDQPQGALALTLYRDERSDYRFNLSSQSPRLFITGTRIGAQFQADGLTLSQSVAAAYMDGDREVLSYPLPNALQAWVEAFIGRHGELIQAGGKGKKGKGRAQEQPGLAAKEEEPKQKIKQREVQTEALFPLIPEQRQGFGKESR